MCYTPSGKWTFYVTITLCRAELMIKRTFYRISQRLTSRCFPHHTRLCQLCFPAIAIPFKGCMVSDLWNTFNSYRCFNSIDLRSFIDETQPIRFTRSDFPPNRVERSASHRSEHARHDAFTSIPESLAGELLKTSVFVFINWQDYSKKHRVVDIGRSSKQICDFYKFCFHKCIRISMDGSGLEYLCISHCTYFWNIFLYI